MHSPKKWCGAVIYEPKYPLFFSDGSLSQLGGMPKCLVPVLSTGDVRFPMHLPLGSLMMEPIMEDFRKISYVPNPGDSGSSFSFFFSLCLESSISLLYPAATLIRH